MTWVWDAPSGTYKNHALSSDIRREAIADTQFMKFARSEPGFGKGKGESVTITRIMKLPLAGRVSETDRLPSGRPAIQTKSISVSEWGFKIPVTEFEKNLTHFDIMNPFQQTLRDQMALTMDWMVATAFKTTPYKAICTTAGVTFDTDGTPSTQATANLSVSAIREIRDQLHGTLKCPKYRNGKYVGILSTRAARGVKNDPEFKDWLHTTRSELLSTGALVDIDGVTLYETNHYDALDNDIGQNSVGGEAVFFGADAVALVTIDEPELRTGLPDDLGRFRETGWVGTLEAGLVWETASLARVIHVTSS